MNLPLRDELKKTWAAVLGTEKIDEDSDFFRLGGNHRLAIDLVRRLNEKLSLGITIREVAENSRYGQQLDLLRARTPFKSNALSPAQREIWIIDQLRSAHSGELNLGFQVVLPEVIDENRLRAAIRRLLLRHPLLNSIFSSQNGQVTAKILSEPMVVLDTRTGASLDERLAQRFDVTREPGIRFHQISAREVFIVTHRLVHDGGAFDVLAGDLQKFYGAVDSVVYWENRLRDYVPAKLELGKTWDERTGTLGENFRFTFGPAIVEAVREFCRRYGASRFQTLLAAFYVLLERYGAGEDLTIATERRNGQGVGCFKETALLRAKWQASRSFTDFTGGEVARALQGASDHAGVPLESLPLTRRGGELFYVAFSFESAVDNPARARAWRDRVHPPIARCPIAIDLLASDEGLELRVEYSTELYGRSLIEDFVKNYEHLLGVVLAHSDRPLESLDFRFAPPVLPTAFSAKPPASIVDRFCRNSGIEFENKVLSAEAFWRRVDAKALRLAQMIEPGEPVGISSVRSLETLIDLVAIVVAGGAFVPYDPRDPEARVRYILEDAGVKICVSGLEFSDEPTTLSGRPPDPSQLAYLIYTSGSTGKPKGVRVSHVALAGYLNWFSHLALDGDVRRVDFSTSLCFDAAITTSLVALAQGKTIVVCPEETKKSPRAFLSYLDDKEIDLCKTTPSYFRLLLNEGLDGGTGVKRAVKWLLTGEAMDPRDTAAWLARHPHHVFYNSYGPTEATVTCAKVKIDRQNIDHYRDAIPIAQKERSAHFHILDRKGRPVPHGVNGELWLQGCVVADGYQRKPDETRRAFVQQAAGDIWYRTGDRVVSLPNGEIYYLGREDDQVKIRGVRIELGEIRHVLCEFDEVSEAKVLVNRTRGLPILVAFVVPKAPVADEAAFRDRIQRYLLTKLPAAASPQNIVLLDRLPYGASAKIDTQALQALVDKLAVTGGKHLVTSPLEMSILRIWRESLPPGKMGTDSNFFQLGGNSLLAMEVMEKINRHFNTRLPADLLFQRPTIRQLGQAITERNIRTHLHHLREAKEGPALFFPHPATGMGHVYGSLRPHLDAIDVYSLSNDRFGCSENPYRSMEEMARAYVAAIVETRPRGPYWIGGFCTGGVVAFEIARQIEEAGREVGGLILIDSFNLQEMGSTDERNRYNEDQLRLAGIDPDTYLAQKMVFELDHNRKLAVDYQPSPYAGRCLFLECAQLADEDINHPHLVALKQNLNGWREPLQSASVVHQAIAASHRTLFRDDRTIEQVGRAIREFVRC